MDSLTLCESGKMQYWTHIFLVEKKLELNTVKEYNLDIAKARLRLYSVNP